jgi:hypothetical protein
VNKLDLTGVPFGREEFVQQQLAERAEAIGTYCDKIGCLPDPEVGLRLLATKSAAAKSSYHKRLLPPSITKQGATACSVHLRRTVAMRALLGEGIGPGIGAISEMDDPEPLTPNADATTRKKFEEHFGHSFCASC